MPRFHPKKFVTSRGFGGFTFNDLYDQECSIQESSNAEQYAVWLGVDKGIDDAKNSRMHINISQARVLIKILEEFVENGYLPSSRRQKKQKEV